MRASGGSRRSLGTRALLHIIDPNSFDETRVHQMASSPCAEGLSRSHVAPYLTFAGFGFLPGGKSLLVPPVITYGVAQDGSFWGFLFAEHHALSSSPKSPNAMISGGGSFAANFITHSQPQK